MSLTKYHDFDFYLNGKDLQKSYTNKGLNNKTLIHKYKFGNTLDFSGIFDPVDLYDIKIV